MTATDDFRTLVLGENAFPFHRLEERVDDFEAILGPLGTVETTTDREALAGLPGSEYDVVVDYLTDAALTDAQLDGLLSFVAGGGGYVPLHCGADLTSRNDGDGGIETRDEPVPELRELIGGHFLTHPEPSEFGVEIVADHPVTAGVDDFRVFDEPYQVAFDDDVTVLARMDHPDLDDYPVAWVAPTDGGRVAYLSLGHTDEAFASEGVRTLLRNAVRWAGDA